LYELYLDFFKIKNKKMYDVSITMIIKTNKKSFNIKK
jgi:hypothetical protein